MTEFRWSPYEAVDSPVKPAPGVYRKAVSDAFMSEELNSWAVKVRILEQLDPDTGWQPVSKPWSEAERWLNKNQEENDV